MTKIAVTIPEAVAMSGIGRSRLYEEIRAQKIIARKAGGRTLILMEDLEAYVRALPVAKFSEAA